MLFIDLGVSNLSPEQFELTKLPDPNMPRTKRWTKYLKDNESARQKWSEIWQSSSDENVTPDYVAQMMAHFYKVVSERIHMYNATVDKVIWCRQEFSKCENDSVEYMCKRVPVPYEIFEDCSEFGKRAQKSIKNECEL